jgi:hypothetical protein
MAKHSFKTIKPYFEEIWEKRKSFEIRKNDGNYKVGDYIRLCEYDMNAKEKLEREIEGQITYILDKCEGLKEGYCVISFVEGFRRE